MITGRGGGAMRGGRIRPPRQSLATLAALNDTYEFNWEKLRDAFRDIHMKNASELAFEQLYRHAYKIVLKKDGERLYEDVKDFEKEWIENILPPIRDLVTSNVLIAGAGLTPSVSSAERHAFADKFLRCIREAWDHHNTAQNMIADILMYLDRGWSHGLSKPPIYAVNIGVFRDHVLRYPVIVNGYGTVSDIKGNIGNAIISTIIDEINMERSGRTINKGLVRGCISMLLVLHETDEELNDEKLFHTAFEPVFLKQSARFYGYEAEHLWRQADTGAWLRHGERRLDEECSRARTYLSGGGDDSLAKIQAVVDQELIAKNLVDFMNFPGTGFRAMIENKRFDDLRLLYKMVTRVDTKRELLKKVVTSFIVDMGNDIARVLKSTDFSKPAPVDDVPIFGAAKTTTDGLEKGANDPSEKPKVKQLSATQQQTAAALKYVEDVLALKRLFDGLLRDCFSLDLILQTAITGAFSDFINGFDRAPEFTSLYLDDYLKRGMKGSQDDEIRSVFDQGIDLIQFLRDKDKFEIYYQKHLGRRLLYQKSLSLEHEHIMVDCMKEKFGNSFTHKFEGMFKDVNLSRELSEQYAKYKRDVTDKEETPIDLSINVLGGNNWPKEFSTRLAGPESKHLDIVFPPEIRRLQDSFGTFYSRDRTGRKLTWVGGLGNADIKCTFPKIEGKTSGPLSRQRQYEISVSTAGMVVLILFNDIDEGQWLSLEDIEAATRLPHSDLINILTSLSVVKTCKVLVKKPPTRTAAKAGDKFTFNREFVSKTFKVKAPIVSAAAKMENEEERNDTDSKALEARKHVIDAAIVRTMKQRKECNHTQLINEIIERMSQFKPDIPLIKNRIEDLIARDYLERMEGSGTTTAYRYLA